jgi:ABC-type glycerol-3-phosphate transport system substrate-binding protein
MKKLLLVLAIAGFAAACNSGSEKKSEEKTDSTVVTPVDTMQHMDTTHTDSTKM